MTDDAEGTLRWQSAVAIGGGVLLRTATVALRHANQAGPRLRARCTA